MGPARFHCATLLCKSRKLSTLFRLLKSDAILLQKSRVDNSYMLRERVTNRSYFASTCTSKVYDLYKPKQLFVKLATYVHIFYSISTSNV